MSPDPCFNELAKQLLVEGSDDCHVVLALCARCSFPSTFGVVQCGDDQKVLNRLSALVLASANRPDAIGVLLDSNDRGVAARWAAITGKLRRYTAYNLPPTLSPDGTVIPGSGGLPTVGVWIMPNNVDCGSIEAFCADLVPDKPGLEYALSCTRSAKQAGHASYKPQDETSAALHAYLAWQDTPGMPLGRSITAQNLLADTPLAKAFVEWLNRVFA
jgi:hypothetical protein